MRKRELQVIGWMAAYNFAGVALFPRAVRVFYPPLFRTPAGFALHVTWRVTFAFAKRWLVARLGREPTGEELIEDHGRRRRAA